MKEEKMKKVISPVEEMAKEMSKEMKPRDGRMKAAYSA